MNRGYRNPEGLTAAGHTTTARDLSVLATRLIQDFPEYLPYYGIKNYRYEGTPKANDTNRNTLLFRDPTVDGLKTGHTQAAGYCLIATAKREFPNLGKPPMLPLCWAQRQKHGRQCRSCEWGRYRLRRSAVRRNPRLDAAPVRGQPTR